MADQDARKIAIVGALSTLGSIVEFDQGGPVLIVSGLDDAERVNRAIAKREADLERTRQEKRRAETERGRLIIEAAVAKRARKNAARRKMLLAREKEDSDHA